MKGWTALLVLARPVFTGPSFAIFTDLIAGWVLTPGRRTITRMLTTGDPDAVRAHDAYHRFVRAGAWSMAALWQVLATHAITLLQPVGVVILDTDDTVFKKTGRSVAGAGVFRDALHTQQGRLRLGTEPGRAHPAGPATVGRLPPRATGQRPSAPQRRADHGGAGHRDDH
ncbi:MAG: transposase [Actinomycetota bacterium]|nr:transposase [Actinomycetota bacterium]